MGLVGRSNFDMGNRIRDLILTTTICIRMRTILCLAFVTVLFSLAMGKTYLVETMDKNPTDSEVYTREAQDVVDVSDDNGEVDTPQAINDHYEDSPAENRYG